jgi:hypothetical protein
MMVKDACATPAEGVMLDDAGKCPCGKALKDCCHKDVAIKSAANEAIGELCMPMKGVESPCGDNEESEKPA